MRGEICLCTYVRDRICLLVGQGASSTNGELLKTARYCSMPNGQKSGTGERTPKMKAVGGIQIPGTLGYDLSFIRLITTPTGRTIRFAANRKIASLKPTHRCLSLMTVPPSLSSW